MSWTNSSNIRISKLPDSYRFIKESRSRGITVGVVGDKERFDWQGFEHLRVRGDGLSLDTRRAPELGGWWQMLTDRDYAEMNRMINDPDDYEPGETGTLMRHALFFYPKTHDQCLVRLLTIDGLEKRYRWKMGMMFFCYTEEGGRIEDMEFIDPLIDDQSVIEWNKIMMVVNRPPRMDLKTAGEHVERMINIINSRLSLAKQPKIPKFPRYSY